jgi:hypothetical protein
LWRDKPFGAVHTHAPPACVDSNSNYNNNNNNNNQH